MGALCKLLRGPLLAIVLRAQLYSACNAGRPISPAIFFFNFALIERDNELVRSQARHLAIRLLACQGLISIFFPTQKLCNCRFETSK